MTESLIDVADAIRNLLEPDPLGPGPGDVVKNNECSAPFEYAHNTLYVWPAAPDTHRQSGDGSQDEERFVIVAAYVLADAGERRTKVRHRDISVALDAKAHAYAEIIRANRVGAVISVGPPVRTLWGDLNAVLNHNAIRTLRVRGFTVTLNGWRLVP